MAIIGGSGLYSLESLEGARRVSVGTPYGIVKDVLVGGISGKKVAFLPRHGRGHTVPPHLVNYRGNIWALRRLGVERVLAATSCGSMNPRIKPGDLAILSQFIDFTRCRPSTFHEGGRSGVAHVDMTEPYCPDLRGRLLQAARKLHLRAHGDVVYACTEGPRFETPAEIRAMRMLGADVVGMTNVPECVLAREAEMCYAAVGIVTNFAAGISERKLTYDEVVEVVRKSADIIQRIFGEVIQELTGERSCVCGKAMEGARAHSPS
ncbi:MAG: S-methyl-5'-thioadenosine phosphorylase [Candidatus Hadarchaeales archaeon]